MQIDKKTKMELAVATEKLFSKHLATAKKYPDLYGAACAPRSADYVEDDPQVGQCNPDWVQDIEPELSDCQAVIRRVLQQLPHPAPQPQSQLTPDNVWVWGGPTPYWGGSMSPDTLLRGAEYFDAQNVIYVYGAITDEMLKKHSKFKKMICQVNKNCRTPGALPDSEEKNAELLSQYSLQYPNIVGAMCDDVCTGYHDTVLPEQFEKIHRGLKKYNPALKLYGVIYAHDLRSKNFELIQPYIDVVNLWFWYQDELLDIDRYINMAMAAFPGKPIIMGVFLHEYGRSNAGAMPELLTWQLEKAEEYLARKQLAGIVILGDREIKKWPQSAAAVKNYLKKK